MTSNFQYEYSPSGQINGESFLVQTEDAINALATQLEQASSDASSALSGVEQAQNTADLALSTAQNAQATASANSQSITTINGSLASLQTQMTESDNALSQRIDQLQSQGDQTAGVVQTAVLFVAQSLSTPQQTQARENIGASPTDSPVFTGNVVAQTLTVSGAINGTATAALQDGDGNDISSFYAPVDSPVLTGNASAENLTVTGTLTATASQAIADGEGRNIAETYAPISAPSFVGNVSASGTVTATGGFVGNLTGTASQAASDGNGNNIAATYATIANTYTKAQVDAKVSSVYRFMGSVATYNDLPSSGQTVGDTYNVEDTGANYAWDGTQWDKLSETVDLSQYLTIASAQSTYLPIDGNAATASKWETARTITLSGDATGSVSLDGSSNATLNLTIANGSVTNAMLAASSVTFAKVNSGDVATQAEAEAGTVNNAFMTPLRVAQAIASQVGPSYLPIAGGTLTGNLILNANPTTALGAATKQYVDSAVSTGTSDAVLYTQQSLSTSQQTQARSNIGVVTLTNDGVQVLGSNVDYNTILDPGIYNVNRTGATNGPGEWANRLIVLRQTGASYITQIAFPVLITNGAAPAYRETTNRGKSWTDRQQFIPVMGGATSSAAGSAGAVPAPAAGENDEFLRGDGTWTFPPNNAVLQTASSANGNYPILLKETTGTSTTTDGSIFDANVYVNPSTGVLTANGFVGNLTGNASTASEWATARTITLSGDATGSVSLDGSADATLNLTIANGSVTNAMLAASSVTFSKVASGDVATQAEAEAGTANNSFMTPLRVAQAIAAQAASANVYVVETYHSGTSWYRIWSDGFVEQGGYSNSPYGQVATITLIKPLNTTNYTILLGGVGGSESSVRVQPENQTKTSFQTARYYSGNARGDGSLYWEALGY